MARDQINALSPEYILILDQVHGIKGYHIHTRQQAKLPPYEQEGDYIITSRSGVALAIETADCIPLILVDTINHRVAAVHAGWKGLSQGIIPKVLDDMLRQGSSIANVQAFLGPSARSCCYKVMPPFLNHFEESLLRYDCVRLLNGDIYFDPLSYAMILLKKRGVKASLIDSHNGICTVCSDRYASYRRQGVSSLRQMAIVALK